jgi:diacylglycerol kinase (ATP)
MPAVFIINPVAGGERSGLPPAEREALARRGLEEHGLPGEVHLTKAPGHGKDLARQALADGHSPIVAWGGDGTINEVASQLAGSGTPLGIVRAGSGNGLARELGIPTSPERAIEIALGARERVVDHGEIDGRMFLNVAGIGFDAAMALEFNQLGGERRGSVRYTQIVARAVFRYVSTRYVIETDDRRIESTALILAIANLAQYGTGAVIAPTAKPDDGLLDVVIVEDRGTLGRVGLVPRLFDRTIHKAPGVTIVPTRRVRVEASVPIAFHVDGEPHVGATVLEARVHPASLVVRVP